MEKEKLKLELEKRIISIIKEETTFGYEDNCLDEMAFGVVASKIADLFFDHLLKMTVILTIIALIQEDINNKL